MEWQSNHKPAESVKEWIDEQAGTLMKWSVPVLSITRSEYLPDIESDMFIFQTPVRLQPTEKENTLNILKSGKPVAVFGSPAGGLDKEISDIIGINTTDTMINEIKYIGTLNYKTDGIWNSLPNTFPVFQPYTKNKFKSSAEIVYSVSGSPCLGLNQSDGKQLIFWDPPEFSNNLTAGSDDYDESLDQILGSPTPYVITSRLINELMKKSNLINVDEISQYQPVNLSVWQSVDGKVEIMAGNLEEGINHCADKRVHSVINLPSLITDKGSFEINEKWSGAKIISGDKKLNIDLDQGQTKLFIIGDKMNSQHD
jgi:hypothetical protein